MELVKQHFLKLFWAFYPTVGKLSGMPKELVICHPRNCFIERTSLPLVLEDFFKFKNVNDGQITQTLNLVGLEPSILKKGFGALSTGEFQRMLIAWGLVDEPEVLLFDEPTSGIDLGGQETVYTLLHNFWKEHSLTILLITHDLSIVWGHADSVLCLNKSYFCYGKPQELITPEQLKKLYGTGVEFYKHSHLGN